MSVIHRRAESNGRRIALACCMVACCAASALGQTPSGDSLSTSSDSSANTAHQHAAWLTKHEAIALGGAVASTVLIAPLDHPISGEFIEPGWNRRRRLHQIADDVAFFGGDGPFVASAVLLAGTSVTGEVGLRRFAVHNIESIALATIVTGIGKGITGRALPGVHARHSFEFGRGFHESNGPFVSFPSGHTAAAFAMAATVAGEWTRADSSHARLIEYLSFGGATAVGIARVAQRMHWPSDLPLAAFIGTWSGRVVQRHAGDSGPIGAVLRGLTAGAGPDGRMAIGWSSLARDGGVH